MPLGITVRFTDQEPLDPVTASYNKGMETILPCHGIRFVEISRISKGGELLPPAARKYLASAGINWYKLT